MLPYHSSLDPLPPIPNCAAFTGHRSVSFPWMRDKSDKEYRRLKASLRAACTEAYKCGKRFFLSGMAEGFDLIAASCVLELEAELPGIALICVFPYASADPSQQRIAERAHGSIILTEEYSSGCMQLRNRFLTDRSSLLIAFYDGRAEGGTFDTLKNAVDSGKAVVLLR